MLPDELLSRARTASYAGWAKKWGHRLVTIILSDLNRFKKKFIRRFLGKIVAEWIIKLSQHVKYVATLPCDFHQWLILLTSMSHKVV